MASVSPSAHPGPGDEAELIQRVPASQRRPVLGVLLTGRPDPNHSLVEQFLGYSRDQGLPLNELYAAYRGKAPVAAALVLPNAGRSGMLFCSPVHEPDQAALTGRVVQTAAQAQSPKTIALLQSLLEPAQPMTERALQTGGFYKLATLQYMQRPATLPARPLELADPAIETCHWSEANRPLFARAIEASYEQTADCPDLVGLRRIEDIITGHMATGRFDPRLWFAFHKAGQPVGVMLLNEMIQQPGFELVYLGLAPAFRGQGLARKMLAHGFGLVSQRAAARPSDNPRLHLAVDETNQAALRLYEQFGFLANTRKVAMIRPLA
jgi:ribosomal protein S18 acetylase RimI-like enzyme